MHQHIASFLGFFGKPTEAEIELWEVALAPVEGDLLEAMGVWLRSSEHKPKPLEIIRIMLDSARPLSMQRIARDIALDYGLGYAELLSRKRHKNITGPRQHAMSKMREKGFALKEISRFFDLDHTTVIHGIHAHHARKTHHTNAPLPHSAKDSSLSSRDAANK